jgi:hypothetical protein
MATVTAGRQIQDRDSIGGIKAIYVLTDSTDNVVLLDDSNTTRSGNTVTDFGTSVAANAVQFDILRGAGGFTQSVEGSIDNGTYSFNLSLEVTLHKIDVATQDAIEALAKTRGTIAILDNNDNVILAGFGNGMEMTGGSFQTGAGYGELNGTTLTFEGKEVRPAPFLTAPTLGQTNYPFDGLTTLANQPTPTYT